MRDDELTLLSESLAGLVREVVTKEVSTLLDCLGDVATALRTELGTVRERMAGLEARPPEPGPPGPPGPAGADGINGKDGVPGLTYCGVYVEGKTYDTGAVVTWAGSAWHCNAAETTSKPGDGSKAWTLMVKAGRDRGK